jgi:hypothetical protein
LAVAISTQKLPARLVLIAKNYYKTLKVREKKFPPAMLQAAQK